MTSNFQNGLKKILVLEQKIESLQRTKKHDETIQKRKKLFHFCSSFASMLLLNEIQSEQFHELLGKASRNYKIVMEMEKEQFDLKWKKQILYYMMASYAFSKAQKPPNMMLTSVFAAQRITSSLDRDLPRNLDYIVAVNTLSALILTKIGKADEALEFILAAEQHLAALIELNIEGAPHGKMLEYLKDKHQAQEEYCEKIRKEKKGKPQVNRMAAKVQVELFDTSGPGNEIRNLKTRQCTTRKETTLNDVDGAPYMNRERAIFSQEAVRTPQGHEQITYDGDAFVGRPPPSVEARDTVDDEDNDSFYWRQQQYVLEHVGKPPEVKPSKFSVTLIQNFLLALSLLKNVSLLHKSKLSNNPHLLIAVGQQLEYLKQIEEKIEMKKQKKNKNFKDIFNKEIGSEFFEDEFKEQSDLSISFLVIQHKKEIVDQMETMDQVIRETLNPHFVRMISTSIFVPFLHKDSPKQGPQSSLPKCEPKVNFVPEKSVVQEVLRSRNHLLDLFREKEKREEAERKKKMEQKYMVQEAIDKMRFLKKNYKQLKNLEKQLQENDQLPDVTQRHRNDTSHDATVLHDTIGYSNTHDHEEDYVGGDNYGQILPHKMKSYQPVLDDEGSFAKDVMPPLGQQVRVSIGSYSMSKQIMTPNDETGGKSGRESAYAPSINKKSIMKQQSVFSPSEGQRMQQHLSKMEQKKVQIMENTQDVMRFKANRDSMLQEKKAAVRRDIESPMVNLGSRIDQQRIRTSPMGQGTVDIDFDYLTKEQQDVNQKYMKYIQEQKKQNYKDQMMIHQQLIKLGMYENVANQSTNLYDKRSMNTPLAEIKESNYHGTELQKKKILSKSRDQAARLKQSFQKQEKRAATTHLQKLNMVTPKFGQVPHGAKDIYQMFKTATNANNQTMQNTPRQHLTFSDYRRSSNNTMNMNKTIGTTSQDPSMKFVKQSPRDINLLIDLHQMNKKEQMLKHGSVLTAKALQKRSPRADDSYEEDQDFDQQHYHINSRRQSGSNYARVNQQSPDSQERLKNAQMNQLSKKIGLLEQHKQRSSYVRPATLAVKEVASIPSLYNMPILEKQLEIKEQVLQSSRVANNPDLTYGSDAYSPDQYFERYGSNSPQPDEKKKPIFVSQVPVNNENYEEVRKRMESDLELLKKMQKKQQNQGRKTFISDTTRSKLRGRKENNSKRMRVVSDDRRADELINLKQIRTIQETAGGMKYLNEITVVRDQRIGRHCHSQSIDDKSTSTIVAPELNQIEQQIRRKVQRNEDETHDEERQAMRDLQNKLDAVPDAYEDRTHDIFEHSNNNSSNQSMERIKQEAYHGFVRKNTKIPVISGKAVAAGMTDDKQFQQMFDHQQSHLQEPEDKNAESKLILEHRRQMEEIYQQKLKVSRRVRRKLSPIKMEKNEAQKFQIMQKRFQEKDRSDRDFGDDYRQIAVDKMMERSQSQRTQKDDKKKSKMRIDKNLTQQGDLQQMQLNYESQKHMDQSKDALTQNSIESQERELKKRRHQSINQDLVQTLNKQSPNLSDLRHYEAKHSGGRMKTDASNPKSQQKKLKKPSNIQVDDQERRRNVKEKKRLDREKMTSIQQNMNDSRIIDVRDASMFDKHGQMKESLKEPPSLEQLMPAGDDGTAGSRERQTTVGRTSIPIYFNEKSTELIANVADQNTQDKMNSARNNSSNEQLSIHFNSKLNLEPAAHRPLKWQRNVSGVAYYTSKDSIQEVGGHKRMVSQNYKKDPKKDPLEIAFEAAYKYSQRHGVFKQHFKANKKAKIEQFVGKTSSKLMNLDLQQSIEEIADGEKPNKKLMLSSMNSSQQASFQGGMMTQQYINNEKSQNLRRIKLNDISRTILKEESSRNASKGNFDFAPSHEDISNMRMDASAQGKYMTLDMSQTQYQKSGGGASAVFGTTGSAQGSTTVKHGKLHQQSMGFKISSPVRQSNNQQSPGRQNFNFGAALPSERSEHFIKFTNKEGQINRFDSAKRVGRRQQVDMSFQN